AGPVGGAVPLGLIGDAVVGAQVVVIGIEHEAQAEHAIVLAQVTRDVLHHALGVVVALPALRRVGAIVVGVADPGESDGAYMGRHVPVGLAPQHGVARRDLHGIAMPHRVGEWIVGDDHAAVGGVTRTDLREHVGIDPRRARRRLADDAVVPLLI